MLHGLFTKERMYLLAIVSIGFVIRIIVASLAPLFLDESYYAYQGALLLKGQIPFVNFYSYPPVPLFGIALSTLISGHSVLAMRISSVVFDTLTVYIVYLIGKDIFNGRVGLLSGLLYSLAPFAIWLGTVANEMPMTVFLLMLTFLLFERSIGGRDRNLFFSGILVGIGWFTSKTLVLLPIVFLIYNLVKLFRGKASLASFLRGYGLLVIGCFVVLIPSYLLLLTKLPLQQLNLMYGLGGISLSSPIPQMTRDINLKVLNQTLVQGLGIYIPATAYLMMVLASFTKRRIFRFLGIISCSTIVVYLIIAPQDLPPFVNYGVVPLYNHLFGMTDVLGVGLILTALTLNLFGSITPISVHNRKKQSLLLLLLAVILGFYEYYAWSTGAFTVYYLWETLAICSILAGAWTTFLIDFLRANPKRMNSLPRYAKIIAIPCLVIVLIAGFENFYAYSNSYSGERPYSLTVVNDAAQYIASHTASSSTILAEPIFAYLSDRSDLINFYTLVLEYTKGGQAPGLPPAMIPTDSGFVQLMQSRDVNYVILDARLYDVISVNLPLTYQYIRAFYSPVKVFPTNYSAYSLAGNYQPYPITILNRSTIWNPADYLGYYPYVQAGAVSQPSANPVMNYTFSPNSQSFMMGSESAVSESNSVIEFAPNPNSSRLSYLQITMPDNPYPTLSLSYSSSNSNSNCSSISNYLVLINAGEGWQKVYTNRLESNTTDVAAINLAPFLGETISIRILPNSTYCSATFKTTVLFESSYVPIIAYPGMVTLLSVYESRSDLQNAFPEATAGNQTSLTDLINWAGEVVNHEIVDSSYQLLSPFAWYYVLMSIYKSRAHLQTTFPDAYYNDTSFTGLVCWAGHLVSSPHSDSSYSVLEQYSSSYEYACKTS